MENSFPILTWRRIIIDGRDTPYIISDKGYVMNDITGEFMLITPDKDNYPVVKLKIDGDDRTFKIHQLVAKAFVNNPLRLPEIDHINRNHWDASKENLEPVSTHENLMRLRKIREIEKSLMGNFNKIAYERQRYTSLQILQVCLRLLKKEPVAEISRKTDVDIRTIYLVRSGTIWKNISCYFSFYNDGLFDDQEIKLIQKYIDDGYDNDEIAKMLRIADTRYFINLVELLRKNRLK